MENSELQAKAGQSRRLQILYDICVKERDSFRRALHRSESLTQSLRKEVVALRNSQHLRLKTEPKSSRMSDKTRVAALEAQLADEIARREEAEFRATENVIQQRQQMEEEVHRLRQEKSHLEGQLTELAKPSHSSVDKPSDAIYQSCRSRESMAEETRLLKDRLKSLEEENLCLAESNRLLNHVTHS